MKLESIKRSRVLLLSSLKKTLQKSYLARLISFLSQAKSVLFFLLIFSFLSFNNGGPILQKKPLESTPIEIARIENPNERAAEWLTYLFELSANNSPDLTNQLAISKELWSNDYTHKGAVILLTKAEISQNNGSDKTTIDKIENAIQLLESSATPSRAERKILCLSYILFCRVSLYFKLTKKGIEHGYKAIGIAQDIDFPVGEIIARNSVAQLIGSTENDMQLVLEHLTKAEVLIPRINGTLKKLLNNVIRSNTAKVWSELGQEEKAIARRLEMLEEEKGNTIPKFLIATHNALGFDYYKLKQFEFAEKHLKKTIHLMNEHNSLLEYKGLPFMRLSLAKLEQAEISTAETYADSIENWLKIYQFVGAYKINHLHLKSKLAKANNDLEKAVYWLEKATEERDSLSKIIGANNIIKLEEQSKFGEIQREKLFLEEQRDSAKSTINTQKVLLLITTLIVILIGLFIGRLFYQQKRNSDNTTETIPLKKSKSLSKKERILTGTDGIIIPKVIDQELMQKIEIALKKEKLYLSQELTLKKFADHLNSNTSYLSKTINEGFQKNFSALINEYRIEEVLRLFNEGEHHLFTIESIYQKAGFKSKSSFQKAFKAKTGQTASHYLNNIKI